MNQPHNIAMPTSTSSKNNERPTSSTAPKMTDLEENMPSPNHFSTKGTNHLPNITKRRSAKYRYSQAFYALKLSVDPVLCFNIVFNRENQPATIGTLAESISTDSPHSSTAHPQVGSCKNVGDVILIPAFTAQS